MAKHTQAPKTGADYSAVSKARLLEAGGRRLTVNLSPTASAALHMVRAHTGASTDREAVELALQGMLRGFVPTK